MTNLQKNILFLFPDQHRGDFMPYPPSILSQFGHNFSFIKMENLKNIINNGMVFTNAISSSPLCAPARACLAFGERYYNCRVPNNQVNCPTDGTTFYQILKENGYQVCGVGKFDLHKADNWWGLDGKLKQHEKWGFTNVIDNAGKMDAAQSYHNNQCPTDPYMNYLSKNHWADYHSQNLLHRKNSAEFSEIPDSLYCDNWITDNAIEMINHFTPEKPWFLQVNFAGPHDPWDITKAMKKEALLRQVPFPQNYTGDDNIIEIRQNYCEMIENIDKNIGRIVKLLKDKCMFENTIIIYSSDHGEMLGDFSMFGKNRPYRSSTHIPLVISGAAIQNKGITNTPVELQDLAKTFTDFANCATTDVLKNSHSLYPLLTNKPYSPRLCAYSSLKNVNQVGNRTNILGFEMILDNEYKYVEFEDGSQELFHIKSDIWEKHNLNTKCPELTKNYHKLLVKETLK